MVAARMDEARARNGLWIDGGTFPARRVQLPSGAQAAHKENDSSVSLRGGFEAGCGAEQQPISDEDWTF